MEDMTHEFHEKEVNNTVQEFSVNFVDLPPYLALVCVIGIVTNAALLYILTKVNLHNTTNALILSLTVSNLLFLLFFIPFDIAVIGSKSYPFTETVCKATETISSLCFFVWPFTLIALNFRCILETPALSGGKMAKRTINTLAAIWGSALALAVPSMVLAFKYDGGEEETMFYCPAYEHSYLMFEIIVQFVAIVAVPVAAVGCYINDVNKRNRMGSTKSRQENDISNTVLMLTAVYTLCLFIRSFLDVLSMHFSYEYNAFYHGVNIVAGFLYFLYPSACAVALFCASGSFRRLFKRHLLFWCKSANQEPVVEGGLAMLPIVHPIRRL